MSTDASNEFPAPTVPGHERDPGLVAPAESYPVGALVWVFKDNGWRPGLVLAAAPRGVLVRYAATGAGGLATDTVTATHVSIRGVKDRR